MSWKCKTCIWISWVKGKEGKGDWFKLGEGRAQHGKKRRGEMAGGFGKQRPRQRGGNTWEHRERPEPDCASGHQTDICASAHMWKEASSSHDLPKHWPIFPREAGRAEKIYSAPLAKIPFRVSFADRGFVFLCCSHSYYRRFKWQTHMRAHTQTIPISPFKKIIWGRGKCSLLGCIIVIGFC